MSDYPIVLAITGASGVIYGRRLLELLLRSNIEVHLTISESGQKVLQHELKSQVDIGDFRLEQLLDPAVIEEHSIDASLVHYHHYKDFMTPIASGSFQNASHGRLSLQRQHAQRHCHRRQRQPCPASR